MSFRLVLPALVGLLVPLLAACSTASPAVGVISEAPSDQSASSYTRAASWTSSEDSGLGGPAPVGWEHSPGWTISGAVTQVFGLNSGLAVVANGILTTYDRHSQMIGTSTPPTAITQDDRNGNTPYAFTTYQNEHPYIILTAHGPMKPKANSTSRTHEGVYYSVFDAENGKLLFETTWEGTSSTLEIARAGTGLVILQNKQTPLATQSILDPTTGKVEDPRAAPSCVSGQPDCLTWAGRFDGVDLFNVNGGVKAPTWSIPGSYALAGDAGPFVNTSPYTGLACKVVDAHTGQLTPWSAQNPGLCAWGLPDYASGVEPFFGVIAMKANASSDRYVYVDTRTGASVSLAADDTFRGEFAGADGKVYGTATPTSAGNSYPAALDLSTKKATILTQIPDLAVLAASGDGIIVLKTAGSALASTSDPSASGPQQLYVLSSQDGTR